MNTTVKARQAEILKTLRHKGSASVEELSAILDVSDMTIRRDLSSLEQSGNVYRTRGGAKLSDSLNLASANAVGRLATSNADVMILNPMDQRMARMLVQDATRHAKPILAESIPFPGITSLIAIDSFRAGVSLGQWVGRYAQQKLDGNARILFVGLPTFADTAERRRGFFEGLREFIPEPAFALTVNGRGLKQTSFEATAAALSMHPDINILVGVNDQSALGAVDAIHQAHLSLDKILVGTFGLEGASGKNILMKECPHAVGVAMFPEFIGRVCADVAVKAYNHLPLPDQVVTPTAIVTAKTLPQLYSFQDGKWVMNVEAVQALPAETWSRDAALLNTKETRSFPKRVDFVRYLHDEYYDQLVSGLQERAKECGFTVQVTDASVDLAASIDLIRRAIGKTAAKLVSSGEAVILDAGTTNTYVAQGLANRHDEKFTVITNSIPVIQALQDAEHITLITIGGILHRPSQSFLGAQAEAALNELKADKAFLGVAGIGADHGISNAYLAEADLKRCILRATKQVIVVADSLKIGQIALAKIAPISAVHTLVTDDQIPSADRLALMQAGVQVVQAPNHS